MNVSTQGINGTICKKYNCSYCCYETEMPLTLTDIARIANQQGLEIKQFTTEKDGLLVLKNVVDTDKKHCFFLKEGLCSIYEIRPKGCRLYPLIWDLDHGKAILDPECPYHEKFYFIKKRLKTELLEHVKELLG